MSPLTHTGLLCAAAFAAAAGPDLIPDNVVFTEITPRAGFVAIGFTYDIVNIGDAPIDLDGPDPGSPFDNAGIQTLLADHPALSGGVPPPAGAPILAPAGPVPGAAPSRGRGACSLSRPRLACSSALGSSPSPGRARGRSKRPKKSSVRPHGRRRPRV